MKFYSLKCYLTPLEQEDELDVKYYLEDSYISDLTVVSGGRTIYGSMRGYKGHLLQKKICNLFVNSLM